VLELAARGHGDQRDRHAVDQVQAPEHLLVHQTEHARTDGDAVDVAREPRQARHSCAPRRGGVLLARYVREVGPRVPCRIGRAERNAGVMSA
jgi:hypothetical protein